MRLFTEKERNSYPFEPSVDGIAPGMTGMKIVKLVEAENKREAVGSSYQA